MGALFSRSAFQVYLDRSDVRATRRWKELEARGEG